MENEELKALKDATDHMCRLFGKHPELGRQAQIFDVLHACFPQEADVFVQSILDYREEIAEMEPSVMLLRLRCEGDNAAFNDGFARLDKRRSFYHDGAISAAKQLNGLCDQLHIEHLFHAEPDTRFGARSVIGEEMVAFAEIVLKGKEEKE